MIQSSAIVLLVLVVGLLWWRLSRTQHENDALQAEIAKLRARARRLRA
jgi:cell division protein FtsB